MLYETQRMQKRRIQWSSMIILNNGTRCVIMKARSNIKNIVTINISRFGKMKAKKY